MCIGVKARIISKEGNEAVVDFGGVKRTIRIDLVKNVDVGDEVMVHAGFAISKVNS